MSFVILNNAQKNKKNILYKNGNDCIQIKTCRQKNFQRDNTMGCKYMLPPPPFPEIKKKMKERKGKKKMVST